MDVQRIEQLKCAEIYHFQENGKAFGFVESILTPKWFECSLPNFGQMYRITQRTVGAPPDEPKMVSNGADVLRTGKEDKVTKRANECNSKDEHIYSKIPIQFIWLCVRSNNCLSLCIFLFDLSVVHMLIQMKDQRNKKPLQTENKFMTKNEHENIWNEMKM